MTTSDTILRIADNSNFRYQTVISSSSSTLKRSCTRLRTRSTSRSTSRVVAPAWTRMKLASRSLTSAPPTRVLARPACSISALALRPRGFLKKRAAAWNVSGWLALRRIQACACA
jgi:hypothetical protein